MRATRVPLVTMALVSPRVSITQESGKSAKKREAQTRSISQHPEGSEVAITCLATQRATEADDVVQHRLGSIGLDIFLLTGIPLP